MHRKRQIPILFAAAFCALLLAPAGFSAGLSPAESGLLDAVNATRTSHGLQPLRVDPTLTRAARSHSSEMLHTGEFTHGDLHTRLADFHVEGPVVGENLAWGTGAYARTRTVISEWLRSPEHRANLLRPSFTRIGIGAVRGRFLGLAGAVVVTADFAGR